MKLLQLHLIAFGPFTDRVLDFSEPKGRLQIVLGANEAGKSTSLRALEGLLFGIDPRSPDAHTHPYGELRIGGLLEGQNADRLEIIRRKGQKGTLRDKAGEPMDEASLKRMLRGVDADAFRALYGLNHETLRLGADALEKAQGKVGESLFDAGLGGLGVGPAIAELTEQAEELFTPMARKKPLNEAIRALVETRKQVRMESTNPEAPANQERGIEAARLEAQDAETERRTLSIEQARLTRLLRAGPLIDKRRTLRATREALGPVVLLAESAATDREKASADRLEAVSKLARLEGEIARLAERIANIVVPRFLLDAALDIQRMSERATVVEAGLEERAAVERELGTFERRLADLAARTGLDARPASDSKLAAALGRIGRDRDAHRLELREVESRVRDFEGSRSRLAEELGRLPSTIDGSEIVASIDDATSILELPSQIASEGVELSAVDARIESSLRALGLFRGSVVDLLSLPVVPIELCDVALRTMRVHEERRRSRTDEIARLEATMRDVRRELEDLLRKGSVPDERDLAAARALRDRRIEQMRGSGDRGGTEIDAVVASVRDADHLADRLRREAARVERHAQLTALEEETARALGAARSAISAIDAEEAVEKEAWTAAWRPAGIEPLGPAEMRGWLERRKLVVDAALDRDARRERLRASKLRLAEVTAGLVQAIAKLPKVAGDPGQLALVEEATAGAEPPLLPSLTRAVALARSLLAESDRIRMRREALERQMAEIETKLVHARSEQEALVARTTELDAAWAKSMARLGLESTASSMDAVARQADLVELARAHDDLLRARGVLDRMDARRAELERDLETVVTRCRADLDEETLRGDTVRTALAIAKRFADAERAEMERKSLAARLTDLQASGADEGRRLARADATLMELARAASCSLEELPRAEARSQEALRLDREIDSVDQDLRALTEGSSIAELEEERASLSLPELGVRLEELGEQIEASEGRRDRAHHSIGALTEGLRKLEHEARAADLAVTAEGHLARAAALLRRHAVLRLAKVVLEREVERYRQSHQGPIIKRAEELYRKLTLGKYEALRVVYGDDETPELRCVRGGREIEISGLSDGTRDQLFLALRLATIERHAAEGEPMPLVLDDVFVHFDDDRTRAGLEVLSDLASVVQVILFTHHARVVELAEREPALVFGLNRL